MKKLLLSVCMSLLAMAVSAQDGVIDVARKVNGHFMAAWPDPTADTFVKRVRTSNLWTRAVYYEGLMALYDIDPDKRYIDYTDRWGTYHKWTTRGGVDATNADNQCCSQTYIDRYAMTGDKRMIEQVGRNLDLQMATGRVDYWTWIDAIQMAMPVYSKYYKATGERRYLDYAIKAYTWTRDTCGGGLFNADEGLWWRDKDFVPPYKEKDGRNCYWSRGNGWVYAALVRVMDDIGRDDPYYAALAADFISMSEALLKCQRPDGYWNVSLISPATYGGPEMTGTALFLYGMSWGIRHGILDPAAYRQACDMAWKALTRCVRDDGSLGYYQGTGKQPSDGQPVTFTSVPDFDDYGTGCFLLGAVEYYKLTQAMPIAAAWPASHIEAKAGTRWWWPGSAVDAHNISCSLSEYARAGIGTVEITPIYGVKGNEKNELPFLSQRWMEALRNVERCAAENKMQVDMNCGTGWPFGGPQVTAARAACKAVFVDTLIKAVSVDADTVRPAVPAKDSTRCTLLCKRAFPTGEPDIWRVIAVYASPTGQKVKRAAPGGEGWVVDHFDSAAVADYLKRFTDAFQSTATPWPATLFNDSYEVYGADWTPSLFSEFARRRGYRLEERLPQLLGYTDDGGLTLADYRQTLAELLYENFVCQWTVWAHRHGSSTRCQAHGSPANLLDMYATTDIPEIEGFGLTDFGIRGLRTDAGFTRPNFSDITMLKYAPSAAHVTGKRLTSAETFTWLTEHFRTSLSQMKPDLDLMFTCGVNRVFFHGSCYSPEEAAWPGWRFYASADISPANSIWRDAPYMMKYIERCQSFLQMGAPDNDFLVYLPVRDMWRKRLKTGSKGLLMMFDIHSMAEKSPEFIAAILAIDSLGYDCDYISDRQLADVSVSNGRLVTRGGASYKALIIPRGTTIDDSLQALTSRLKPYLIFGENDADLRRYAGAERMRTSCGLRAIRRSNGTGHHYFIANLTPDDVSACVPLSVGFRSAVWFNPMDGRISPAQTSGDSVYVNLRSGESRILQTFNAVVATEDNVAESRENTGKQGNEAIDLTQNKWTLNFTDARPAVDETFTLDRLQTWESLSAAAGTTMGTGAYTTTVRLNAHRARKRWEIDLGDVRESARVYINGTLIGCAWAAPFTLDCGQTLRKGDNEIRIEVTNLPANRIADMDRKGREWRIMKDINVVDINYKHTTYANWQPVASGLNSSVILKEK